MQPRITSPTPESFVSKRTRPEKCITSAATPALLEQEVPQESKLTKWKVRDEYLTRKPQPYNEWINSDDIDAVAQRKYDYIHTTLKPLSHSDRAQARNEYARVLVRIVSCCIASCSYLRVCFRPHGLKIAIEF